MPDVIMSLSSRSPFDGTASRCIDHYMAEHNILDSQPIMIPAAAGQNAGDQGLDLATGTDLTDQPTVVLCATTSTRSIILKLSAPNLMMVTANLHDFWRAAGTLTVGT
ncbi:hypothetical protein ABIB25_005394 [Nakamurella sp. UYEF19]|uniref:hypothetical protein n=1 Tax=Nakamurella sp. UYEF19 TaxID=1756392 RepID=UPI003393FA8C